MTKKRKPRTTGYDTCDVRYTCPSIPMYDNPELLEDCAIAKKMHEDGSN